MAYYSAGLTPVHQTETYEKKLHVLTQVGFFCPFWRPILGLVPNGKKYVFPNFKEKIPNSRNKTTWKNPCDGYSKELSQWDGSIEHPKQMFELMDKKIFTILRLKITLI